jgi:signal transduction histidine kinase
MEVSEARRLRQLEDENRRLKSVVADLTLDNRRSRPCWGNAGEGGVPTSSGRVRGGPVWHEMAERVERLIRSLDELVQAVSHELGSPLSRLRFDLELPRTSRMSSARSGLPQWAESSTPSTLSWRNVWAMCSRMSSSWIHGRSNRSRI